MAQYESKGVKSILRNSSDKERKSSSLPSQTNFSSYRVKDIILDDTFEDSDSSLPKNDPPHDFKYFGEWNGIGTIIIEPVNDNAGETNKNPTTYAYPLFPNIKHYPLKEEIVWVIQVADADSNLDVSKTSNYYLPPINIWNSQIHNAIPNETQTKKNPNTIDDYQNITNGDINADARRISGSTTNINLGETFNENNVTDVHPLLPYEGDIIYEGRFGNSIRFGSTVKDPKYKNNWSEEGDNSDPITILRNGQSDTQLGVTGATEAWIPCIENINDDQSSIYLTSTQKVPLTLPTSELGSYTDLPETPQFPDQFAGNQILLSSGRLVFNAKNDHVIITADKSVHLASNSSINIDTNVTSVFSNEIRLTAPKVYLGDYLETQPVILGNNLKNTLNSLLLALENFGTLASTANAAGVPVIPLQTEGLRLSGVASDLRVQLDTLLSKTVNTI
jgi:hypothetical protein